MILDCDIREKPVSHRLLSQLMLLLARLGKDLLLLVGGRRSRGMQAMVLATKKPIMILEVRVLLLLVESVHGGGQRHYRLLLLN